MSMKEESKLKLLKSLFELEIDNMVETVESEFDEEALGRNQRLASMLTKLKKLKKDVLCAESEAEIQEIVESLRKDLFVSKTKKRKTVRTKTVLSVVFPDGEKIEGKTNVEVFVESIKKLGEEKIASLGLMCSREHVVTKTKKPRKSYYDNYKPGNDGWYIWVPGNTKHKVMLLEKIAKLLDVKIDIQSIKI